MNKARFIVLVCWPLLWLAGCATVPPPQPIDHDEWLAHVRDVHAIERWQVNAKLLGDRAGEKFRARFLWEQYPNGYEIQLLSAFGNRLALIKSSKNQVEVITSKGQRYVDRDVQALTKRLFNIELPIAEMRYWSLGVPNPKQQHDPIEFNELGYARAFNQSGWLVQYQSYQQDLEIPLPREFSMVSSDFEARVIVASWRDVK